DEYQRHGVSRSICACHVVCSGHGDQCSQGRCTCHTAADGAERIEEAQLHELGCNKVSDDHRDQCDQRAVYEEDQSLLFEDLDETCAGLYARSDQEQCKTELSQAFEYGFLHME